MSPANTISEFDDLSREDIIAELLGARDRIEKQAAEMADLAGAVRAERERADAARRSKSEFMALLSHEFRTPLTAVLGFCHIAESGLERSIGAGELRDNIRCIREAGKHLLDLVDDLLDMAKIESGRHELDEEEFLLSEVIDAAVRLLHRKAGDCGVRVVCDLEDPAYRLRADRRMIKQILTNLLSNAIKFTPEGGRVTLRAGRGAGGVYELRVSDNGIGMTAEEIGKALLPFGQIDSPQGRQHQGTGLGLPLAKSLIELHGGSLEITSSRAAGTSMMVLLPPERIVSNR